MHTARPRALGVALALALTLAQPVVAQKGVFADSATGISIKAPPGWVFLGGPSDLGAARGVFCAPQPSGMLSPGVPHTATMRVLFFPAGAPAAEASAEKSAFPQRTPYRSFDDYMSRVRGPRLQQKSAEPMSAAGQDGRLVTAAAGPLALQWLYLKTEAGEIAIELEVVESALDSVGRTFAKALKTLALVAPKDADSDAGPGLWNSDRTAWAKMPAAARAMAREDWGKKWLAARKARKEPDWKGQVKGPILVLTRADAKTTKKFTAAATVAREWIEKRFAAVSDEAALPVVIRLFDSRNEHDAFRAREVLPRPYDPDRREIYCFKDSEAGTTGEDLGVVVRGVFQQVIHDKDPRIIANLPRWIDFGINEYLRSSNIKGKKIEFVSSDVETGRIAYYAQNNQEIPPLWNLIQESIVPTPQGGAPEEPWGYTPECARLVRWFEADGSAAMGAEDFVVKYLQAVGTVADKAPPDPAATADLQQLDESKILELNRLQYERRDKFLTAVNDAACPLEVPQWQKANDAWLAFNAKIK